MLYVIDSIRAGAEGLGARASRFFENGHAIEEEI
jgi:hypothetical protein